MTLKQLSTQERRQLLRFVCSFAWADLEVVDAERALLKELVGRMGLDADESAEVEGWISHPPDPSTIDPMDVPRAHRELFLAEISQMVVADGVVAEGEAENLALFQALIA